ncbi:sulfotransferase family 2 domain-containing protein [Neolewinella agarilytica]|uniref:Sulfotransferase family protein n=1 Tax=Neolewinella agarilytica TaxID=478744 RepID=A0A1H9G576_9BACT|nr:sulfotransferase family 2 domain-containing protein [Neolewinella agarilytica]SEQ45315.1 Sulfotransferase family protein [Neolewinella agarilytica]
MIISHEHKFIYFKNRKTAGTSIEISLSKICGEEDIITPLPPADEKIRHNLGFRCAQNYKKPRDKWSRRERWIHFRKGKEPRGFYNHISCEEVSQIIDQATWDSYFKFTTERNPFDKVVSFYYWRKADEKYERISDWISDGGLAQMRSYDLYAIGKLPAVDTIYRYESFDFFEKDLTEKLQLDEPFKMIKYKAKSNSRKVRNYKDVLDEKAIELIKIAFAREISLLGYTL